MPKATHLLKLHNAKGRFDGSPIAVYGDEDLKRHLESAAKAGIRVTVREVGDEGEEDQSIRHG